MSRHPGDGRDPQGAVDRALRRGPPRLVAGPARTSRWRRSTPAWSTPAATGRGCSPGASSSWLGPQVWRSDDLGETWQETPNGAVRFPEDTGAAVARVWQLDARRRGRRRVRRHRAGRDLQVRPTAARPSSSSAGCGTTRSARSGTPASAARPSTRSCPTREDPQQVLAAISTGGVYRTDDGGDSWYPSNTGREGRVHARGAHLPGVRPVRAQGDPPPRRPRPALPAEPRRRLPLRRRRRHLAGHRARAAGRVRLPDRGRTPTTPRRVYAFPIVDAGARWPVDGHARVWRSTDGGSALGAARRRRAARRLLRRGDARRDVRRHPRRPPGSTSAAATARSGPRPTRARPGARSTRTCPTCCVRARRRHLTGATRAG